MSFPKIIVEVEPTMFPVSDTRNPETGNPTMLPRMTSLGFLAYLWKSAALEAKVAQLSSVSLLY
jgi:hypothetical protein